MYDFYTQPATEDDIRDLETCDACGEEPVDDWTVGLCSACAHDVAERAVEDHAIYLETINRQHAADMRRAA